MSDLEERLRRGHPEERGHRPKPFDEIVPRAAGPAVDRRLRWATLVVAAFGIVAVAILSRPIAYPERLAVPASAPPSAGHGAAVRPDASRPPIRGFADSSVAPAASEPAHGPVPAAGGPTIDCGPASEQECDQIVGVLTARTRGNVIDVDVDQYSGGWEYFARYSAADGSGGAQFCDAATTSAECRPAASGEIDDLALLTIVVDDAERRPVLLHSRGSRDASVAAPIEGQTWIAAGTWTLRLASEPSCSREFAARPRQRLTARVTTRDREPCRIEVR